MVPHGTTSLKQEAGCSVKDVMTPEPLCIRGMTSLEAAARMLLERKVRHLASLAGVYCGQFPPSLVAPLNLISFRHPRVPTVN